MSTIQPLENVDQSLNSERLGTAPDKIKAVYTYTDIEDYHTRKKTRIGNVQCQLIVRSYRTNRVVTSCPRLTKKGRQSKP